MIIIIIIRLLYFKYLYICNTYFVVVSSSFFVLFKVLVHIYIIVITEIKTIIYEEKKIGNLEISRSKKYIK